MIADAKLLKILANVFASSSQKVAELKKVVYIADAPQIRDEKMEAEVNSALETIKSRGVEARSARQPGGGTRCAMPCGKQRVGPIA